MEVAVHTALIKWRFRSTCLDPGFLISIISPMQRMGCQTQCSSQRPCGASIPISQMRNLSSEPESACQDLHGESEVGVGFQPGLRAARRIKIQPPKPPSTTAPRAPHLSSYMPGTVLSAVRVTTLQIGPRTARGRSCSIPIGQVGKLSSNTETHRTPTE